MGRGGSSYREILAFYYPGTVVGRTGRGITWQRLSGEVLSLETTQPDRDRSVLESAERLARGLAARTGWPLPTGVELRAYPDLDAFRNATGEPGWVAAHTEGRRIELQPVAVLRSKGALESTLRHELLHVIVGAQAKAGLPVWFREGVVGLLEGEHGTSGAAAPPDRELRQTQNANSARKAYAESTGAVTELARVYGETKVLDWVRRGLPPDVAKASSNPAATKSK
jgi:stage II sporulation protein D